MKSKLSKKKVVFLAVWLLVIVLILAGIIMMWPPAAKHESIQEAMLDSVLHESNKLEFFGLSVNPAVVSAYIVTAVLLLVAALFPNLKQSRENSNVP